MWWRRSRRNGGSALERDAAIALRRIEAAAREIAKSEPGGNDVSATAGPRPGCRPQGRTTAEQATSPRPASSLIIP